MPTLMYRTAGESHGPALIALIEGMPHGCPIDVALINRELLRRQGGYGRGGRQKIETDQVQFLAGVRMGKTIGSPIAILVPNKDNRLDDPAATPPLYRPRLEPLSLFRRCPRTVPEKSAWLAAWPRMNPDGCSSGECARGVEQ